MSPEIVYVLILFLEIKKNTSIKVFNGVFDKSAESAVRYVKKILVTYLLIL